MHMLPWLLWHQKNFLMPAVTCLGKDLRKEFLPVLRLLKLYCRQPGWKIGNGSFFEAAPPHFESSEGTMGLVHREVPTVSDATTINPFSGVGEKAHKNSIANVTAPSIHQNPVRPRYLGNYIVQINAPIAATLEFLSNTEFNSGKAYIILNISRSDISSTHTNIDFVRIGEHPLVIQLLKGAYNMNRPPLPRYSCM